jgi:hypothetical protein
MNGGDLIVREVNRYLSDTIVLNKPTYGFYLLEFPGGFDGFSFIISDNISLSAI